MQPSLWSDKLEEVGKGVLAPIPVYPRLWEYISNNLIYVGYNQTIKDAMAKWGNLDSKQLAIALDTSQPPWLGVSSVGDDFGWQWYVLGETILIEERFVKLFETNTKESIVQTSSGRVEYIGALMLLGLVVWGNQKIKPVKSFQAYQPQFDGFCKAVYGMDFRTLGFSARGQKPIHLIRK